MEDFDNDFDGALVLPLLGNTKLLKLGMELKSLIEVLVSHKATCCLAVKGSHDDLKLYKNVNKWQH